MKKLLTLALAGVMLFAFTACSKGGSESSATQPTVAQKTTIAQSTPSEAVTTPANGVTEASSPVVTDEVKTLIVKASQDLTDVSYTPVAYVSTKKATDGTTHIVLCQATYFESDSSPEYVLMTLREDNQGNAEILSVQTADSDDSANTENEDENTEEQDAEEVTGAWQQTETPVVTDKARTALTKATKTLTGVGYSPIALLETQVVSGTNYAVLCKATPVATNAKSYYAIVRYYEDLSGNASVLTISNFAVEELEDDSAAGAGAAAVAGAAVAGAAADDADDDDDAEYDDYDEDDGNYDEDDGDYDENTDNDEE